MLNIMTFECKKGEIYDNVSSNSDLSNKRREDYLSTHSDIKEIGSKMYYDVLCIIYYDFYTDDNRIHVHVEKHSLRRVANLRA